MHMAGRVANALLEDNVFFNTSQQISVDPSVLDILLLNNSNATETDPCT